MFIESLGFLYFLQNYYNLNEKKKLDESCQQHVNAVILVAVTLRLKIVDIDREFVFLIAAQIRVAHEVKCVLVMARAWCDEVQFYFGLLLQRQPFDGQQRI